MAFHPDRIQAARDLLGANLSDLAESAGLSQSYLSEIGNGKKPFLAEHARALALATGLPVEFFEVFSPKVATDTLQFRKLKSTKAKDTRRAEQYFREMSRVAQVLASDAGLRPKPLPRIAAEVESLSRDDIEDSANQARALLGIVSDGPVPNLTRALERLGVVVAPVILDPLSDEVGEMSPGHFGISTAALVDRIPLIGFFPGASADRDRFTLAHEFGHLLLHSGRIASDPEDEANRFAGALLISSSAMKVAVNESSTLNQLARVKAQFGLSIQALIMRASNLGLISEERKRSLFVQLSVRGWRQKEPVEVDPEHPILFAKLFELWGPSTTRDIERALALPSAYIRAMAPTVPKLAMNPGAPIAQMYGR